jgi:hypothetical protein
VKRHEYRLNLKEFRPPSVKLDDGLSVRHPGQDDVESLAALVLNAYRGTLDDEGEDLDGARELLVRRERELAELGFGARAHRVCQDQVAARPERLDWLKHPIPGARHDVGGNRVTSLGRETQRLGVVERDPEGDPVACPSSSRSARPPTFAGRSASAHGGGAPDHGRDGQPEKCEPPATNDASASEHGRIQQATRQGRQR